MASSVTPSSIELIIGQSQKLTIIKNDITLSTTSGGLALVSSTNRDIATYSHITTSITANNKGNATINVVMDNVTYPVQVTVITQDEYDTLHPLVIIAETDIEDKNFSGIRTTDELTNLYQSRYFTQSNYPYKPIRALITEAMPKTLRWNNANEKFYDFVERLYLYHQRIKFWAWILETQFWVLTAKGKFLDNLGRWLGITRPPSPLKRSNDPIIIHSPTFEKSDMTQQEFKEFQLLHSYSTTDQTKAEAVSGTYYASVNYVGDVLVNDNEYRTYLLGLLQLKNTLDLETILNAFARILIKPFFIDSIDKNKINIIASYFEDSVRLVIVREMTAKIRTTGINIEVTQALETDMERIKLRFGENCWEQPNPYRSNEEEVA